MTGAVVALFLWSWLMVMVSAEEAGRSPWSGFCAGLALAVIVTCGGFGAQAAFEAARLFLQ